MHFVFGILDIIKDDDSSLWSGLSLPVWSAERTYDLYLKRLEGHITPVEDEEYTRLLMAWIQMDYAQRQWAELLRKSRLDPADSAQELLLHIRRKTLNYPLRKPCVNVFRSVIATMVRWYLLSRVKDRVRRISMETPETDYFRPRENGEMAHHIEDRGMAGLLAVPDAADPEAMSQALRIAEDTICSDIPQIGGCEINIFDVIKLYRIVRRWILLKNDIPNYDLLPGRLKRAVPLELHGIIVSRTTRVLYGFAENGM